MHIFIDTNILLDMYHLSGPDLDELKKIVELMEAGKITVEVNSQVEDEFWRNRERVIADASKQFKETKAISKLPNLVRTYEETETLKKAIDSVNSTVKEISRQLEEDIQGNNLKADDIINELFTKTAPPVISDEIIEKSKRRVELGNPPGKKGSMGDAIHWEWLLDNVPDDEDLVIISSDGDFESVLIKGDVKEYLRREWMKEKHAEVILKRSLPEYLKEYFPHIKLSDEVGKIAAIEKLVDVWNFKDTHAAIAKLSDYDDFTDDEAHRIIEAYVTNNQIHWVLGDTDVLKFAYKILEFVKTDETADLATQLKDMIFDIEGPPD